MAVNPDDAAEQEKFRKLLIKGLDHKTTEETLKSYFQQWGEIVYCSVRTDPAKSKKGTAYIAYKKAHMVVDAEAAKPHKIDGREVELQRVCPRKTQLFVGHLTDDLGEKDLKEYFGKYGNIVNVNVIHKMGRKTRISFVEFDDYAPVEKVVAEGRHVMKGKRLLVKKARSELEKVKFNEGRKRKQMKQAGKKKRELMKKMALICGYGNISDLKPEPIVLNGGMERGNVGGIKLEPDVWNGGMRRGNVGGLRPEPIPWNGGMGRGNVGGIELEPYAWNGGMGRGNVIKLEPDLWNGGMGRGNVGGFELEPDLWNRGMGGGNVYPQVNRMPRNFMPTGPGNSGGWVEDFGNRSYSAGPMQNTGPYLSRGPGLYGSFYGPSRSSYGSYGSYGR